jgi:hypothetical protein
MSPRADFSNAESSPTRLVCTSEIFDGTVMWLQRLGGQLPVRRYPARGIPISEVPCTVATQASPRRCNQWRLSGVSVSKLDNTHRQQSLQTGS